MSIFTRATLGYDDNQIVRTIPLSKGMYALVSEDDFEYINQWKWSYHSAGYACRRKHLPSSRENQKYEIILMHRALLGVAKGDKKVVDHIDGNKLNNTRENIRLCEQSNNMWNARKKTKSSSIYKGVSWYKPYSKWKAYIQKNGKSHHIGYFDNEADAALAYNNMAIDMYGEYANLNVVGGL